MHNKIKTPFHNTRPDQFPEDLIEALSGLRDDAPGHDMSYNEEVKMKKRCAQSIFI